MVRKQIILPFQLYKDLIADKKQQQPQQQSMPPKTPIEDLKGEAALEFAKKELQRVKRMPKKRTNVSARNVLYQQKLGRYLRTRKQLMNRPIKVKLADGSNVQMKPAIGTDAGVQVKPQSPVPQPQFEASVSGSELGDSVITGAEDRFETPKAVEPEKAPLKGRKKSGTSTPPKPETSAAAAAERRPKRVLKNTDALIKDYSARLVEEIRNNPEQFRVTPDDQIIEMRRGNVIQKSDIVDSAFHIVSKLFGKKNIGKSPKGSGQLLNSLRDNDLYKEIQHVGYSQTGHGKKKTARLINSCKPNTEKKIKLKCKPFRPSKWVKLATRRK